MAGSPSQYIKEFTWKQDEKRKDAAFLAKAIEYLIAETPVHQLDASDTLELLLRRFSYTATSDLNDNEKCTENLMGEVSHGIELCIAPQTADRVRKASSNWLKYGRKAFSSRKARSLSPDSDTSGISSTGSRRKSHSGRRDTKSESPLSSELEDRQSKEESRGKGKKTTGKAKATGVKPNKRYYKKKPVATQEAPVVPAANLAAN